METLPVLVIIVVIALFFAFVRNTAGKKRSRQYDERQILARGKAYKCGFLALCICLLMTMMAESVFKLDMSYVGASACLFVGLCVVAVYSIWHDAFFSMRQKPGLYLLLCLLIVGCNGIAPVTHYLEGERLAEILHSVVCLNITCALCFLVVGVTILLKMLLQEKGEE